MVSALRRALAGVDFSESPYNRNVSAVNEPTFFSSMGRRSQTPGLSLVVPIKILAPTLWAIFLDGSILATPIPTLSYIRMSQGAGRY